MLNIDIDCYFFFQPIAEFIDKICSKCRNLEELIYDGITEPEDKISNDTPRMPSKAEHKFPKIKYIKIGFWIENDERGSEYNNYDHKIVMENFKNYLATKCPNLDKPIHMECDDHGLSTFESK